jgi:hypothetical protein
MSLPLQDAMTFPNRAAPIRCALYSTDAPEYVMDDINGSALAVSAKILVNVDPSIVTTLSAATKSNCVILYDPELFRVTTDDPDTVYNNLSDMFNANSPCCNEDVVGIDPGVVLRFIRIVSAIFKIPLSV